MFNSQTPSPIILALAALISGLFAGLAALAIALLAGWSNPWAWSINGAALIAALAWLALLRWWQRLVESAHGIKPEQLVTDAEPIRIEVIDDQGGYIEGRFLDAPIERMRLAELGVALTTGASFSHASLAGPGRPLSRAEYESLRDAWLSAGLVRWSNERAHNQGLQLTARGRATARGFASMASAHPQLQEVTRRN